MQEQTKIEETVDSVKDYLNTRYELTVLQGADKLAHIGSNVLSVVPLVFLTGLTFVMLSFALALYLNTVLVSSYMGFLVVGGGYFVVVLALIGLRKEMIAKPFRNRIIRELFKSQNPNHK